MSTAYITELSELGLEAKGNLAPAPKHPAKTVQALTFTTSTASAAFNGATQMVRIVSPTACHYKVGGSPTASTSSTYLPADYVEYLMVTPGDKIAFVDAA